MRRFMLAIAMAAGLGAGAQAQTVVGAVNSTLPPWRCGVDGTFAPHAFPTMDGKTQGFQVDLFDEIGKRMGRRIEITSASFSGLMDEAVPDELLGRIRRVVGANAQGAIEAHDLRTRHAGRLTFIEFHLVVPGGMTVDDSHAICDRIEAALKVEVDGAVISIHVEPEGKAKHQGVIVL